MTEEKAREARKDIERVFRKWDVFYKVEEEMRPNLRMITFKEASIRVTENER